MKCIRFLLVFTLLLFVNMQTLKAAVVVIQNGTDRVITFTIQHKDVEKASYTLAVGQTLPVPVGREPVLQTTLRGKPTDFLLVPYQIYMFGVDEKNQVGFQGIEMLGKFPEVDDVPKLPKALKPLKLPIHLVTDNKDVRAKAALQKLYFGRIQEASNLLEKNCGVKLEVDETTEWGPQEGEGVSGIYREFKETFTVKEPRLALAYTLRVPVKKPKKEDDEEVKPAPEVYGKTGMPWQTHMLMRDQVPATELERVEVLVHHLGLHLGGVTSPDPFSVMRSNVVDGKAIRAQYTIRFDPINIMIMNIWAEEIREGRGRTWGSLNSRAAARLKVLYGTLAKAQPDEIVISDYVTALEGIAEVVKPMAPDAVKPPMKTETAVANQPATPRELATRRVVAAMVKRAKELSLLPVAAVKPGESTRPKDDELTAELIRAAAVAAQTEEEPHRAAAFLIGLGIGLDDSTILRKNPLTRQLCVTVESDEERKTRLTYLGSPTFRERRDLCQHFAVSLALTAILNPEAAEMAGVVKEQMDMRGQSGFSFVDLLADLSGVELARRVIAKPELLKALGTEFRTTDYLPGFKNLREGLSEARFQKDFGSTTDERFLSEMKKLRELVASAPGFKQ